MSNVRVFFTLCLILMSSGKVMAQLTLTDLPPNYPVPRLFTDGEAYVNAFGVFRPALSIRGFDATTMPAGTAHGLGLKQVLEGVYGSSPDFLIQNTYDRIIELSNETLSSSTERGDIDAD